MSRSYRANATKIYRHRPYSKSLFKRLLRRLVHVRRSSTPHETDDEYDIKKRPSVFWVDRNYYYESDNAKLRRK